SLLVLALVPALLERVIARRQRRDQAYHGLQRWLQRFLAGLQRIPLLRLMQTMQLTLQSNLRSRSFMAVYLLAVMVAMVLGAVQVLG
ncbi:hypothetical protein, partial [Enterobacter hormaechei]